MKVKYRQLYSNDCGICSIKNLLNIYKIKVKDVNIKISKEGISSNQLKKYLLKYFKKVEVISFNVKQLKNVKTFTPYITLLKKENNSHYVVVYKKNKKYIYILDSICKKSYKIKYDKFCQIDGKISIIPEENINIYTKIKKNYNIFLISFLSIFEALFNLSTAILIQQIIDNGIKDAILFIIVQILLLLILKYKTKVFLKLFIKLDDELITPTIIKIYNLKYKFIKSHNIDELYYRINDAYSLKEMILNYLFTLINDIVLLLLSLLLVFIYSKIVFLIMVVLMILIFIYTFNIFKKNTILLEEKRKKEYNFINYYKDSFNNIKDIYILHNKTYENTSIEKLKELQKSIYKCEKLSLSKNYNLAAYQAIIICVLVCLYFTSLYKYLSIGSLIALINIVSLCLQPLLNLCSLLTCFSNYKLIKERLDSINNNT